MDNYIYEFKDLPDTSTPYNSATFKAMQMQLLEAIYPIGSVMIKDDDVDYSNYLGFNWERVFDGCVPVGLDTTQEEFNTVSKTGGSKEVTLTIGQIPEHNHSPKSGTKFLVNTYPTISQVAYQENTGATKYFDYDNCDTTSNTGGGQAHNNLQPYTVVVYWKRVS